MGVVRDVTVEQLAQAVGGIDTSGLAKDTTLQATNTALGIINTTLGGITTNDPPTDTTQQSIAAAIINLGAALGSDKANIDGSNIVNPSAWRSAIRALYDIYLQVFVAPASGTDLNTLVSNAISIYQIGNISQYGNAPSGKGSTGLLIIFRADTYVIQLWLSNTTISQRASYNSGGTWGNWL